MNEQIDKLAEQATTKISFRIDPNTYKHIDDPTGPHVRKEFSKEKFAELIIQECIRIGSISFQNDNSIVPVFPSKQIKDHFEV